MGMLTEFKDFAMRGNVVDLAVGVVIGGAFQKIVTSVVQDIITPPLGLIMGRVNLTDMFLPLSTATPEQVETLAAAKKAGIPYLAYGAFITGVIDFLIMAFFVFLMVKGMNRLTAFLNKSPPDGPKTK